MRDEILLPIIEADPQTAWLGLCKRVGEVYIEKSEIAAVEAKQAFGRSYSVVVLKSGVTYTVDESAGEIVVKSRSRENVIDARAAILAGVV